MADPEPRVALGVIGFARVVDGAARPDVGDIAPGRIVKIIDGDLMTSYPSVTSAIGQLLAVRRDGLIEAAAISCGDVTFERGDVFGTPVVEASRLLGRAEPGTILAVRRAVRLAAPGTATFRALESLDLRGLPAPVPVVAID